MLPSCSCMLKHFKLAEFPFSNHFPNRAVTVVREMQENGDDEEEEEIIVYANFEEGIVERETFQIPNVKLKIIGLDSETPLVQLRDSAFKGEWKDAIGTKLLLEEDSSPEQVDAAFTVTPDVMLKYKCQSRKILELSKVLLKKKCVVKPEENNGNSNMTLGNGESVSESVDDDVVQGIIKPDNNTDSLMKDIVNEALIN